MSLAILFHFLCAQYVSDINISIIRNLQLFCWITTLVVLYLVRCVLEFQCGWVGVVSVLQAASACNTDTIPTVLLSLHKSILHLHVYSVYIHLNIILRTVTKIRGFPTKSVYVILGAFAGSWKISYYFRHVRPSARTYRPASCWTYFREIWYWEFSWKSVEKNLVWAKTDKNIGHFTGTQVRFVLNRRH